MMSFEKFVNANRFPNRLESIIAISIISIIAIVIIAIIAIIEMAA